MQKTDGFKAQAAALHSFYLRLQCFQVEKTLKLPSKSTVFHLSKHRIHFIKQCFTKIKHCFLQVKNCTLPIIDALTY